MNLKNKIIEIAGIAALLLILTVYFFRENLPFPYGMLRAYHDQLLHTWILAWDAQNIFHNPFDIFNTNILYPAPDTLALSDHLFGLLPNWFIGYWLSHDYVAAHNYAFLLTYIFNGMAAFLYFRYLRLNIIAAAGGAVFFAFHQYFYLIDEIQMASFGYTFMVFLFMEKFLRESKNYNLIFMSAFYIIGFLTGLYFAYMLTISVVIYLIITLVMSREMLTWKKLGYILLAFSLSSVILFPTIYPYIKLKAEHIIAGATTEFLITKSMPIDDIYFIGWVTFVVAGSAYLIFRPAATSRRLSVIFFVIALTFYILSLGPYLKISNKATRIPLPYQLFGIIPGFTDLRLVWRYHFMARVGDAFIISALINALVPKKSELKFSLRILTRIFILALVAFVLSRPLKPTPRSENVSPINHAGNLPTIYRALTALPEPGPIVEFPLLPSMKSDIYIYQYFSLYHRRKLFNGNSGYAPYGARMMWSDDLPREEWAKYFRALGTKFIVSHPPDFLARIVASSYRNTEIKTPPLPPPDPKRLNSIIWIDPIEKAVYMNGLITTEMDKIIRIFNINILKPDALADCGKDKFVVDLGHDTSKLVKPKTIPDLPLYATVNGNVLSIAHRDLGKMIADMGNGAHYILLQHGIDRIEVNGFRYLFEENLRNPFFNITQPEARELGLTKVAEADESVIWRIEPTPDVKLITKPQAQWSISTVNNSVLKIEVTLSVPPGATWKNPNLFGANKGHIRLVSADQKTDSIQNVYLNLPLVITDGRPFTAQVPLNVSLPQGLYKIYVDFPDLSPTIKELQIVTPGNKATPL